MSRRRRATPRTQAPDPRYRSVFVAKFVNNLMWAGKKTIAQKIFYGAMDLIEKRTKEDGYAVFQKAMNNVKPVLEVRPRRVGGATYQIPMEVRPRRREALASKWVINAARARNEYTMTERLATELIDASRNQGAAVKKKEDTHKMAEANRAFAHYRW
ncbi:30S ribosomal protein S7 [candidate division WOR-3 bacterium JGI_Cruoil_03_51_56]|uniref:Small ribosomal subunit protein uS7 n=1 Tax=candidate division WOR-3 bacterium JGI_Cruoil_03_51_56 TaxID=1973747 RepID=A0A235BU29_UNCW3|nr:MAG: 30S ribosomal protein S7 [candidate division WOR-3 bacterium JGI_Cruoil_03_51_56]OYD15257.1 MAG: 30S ribosomal protein S7 [candidate division WOR-3 bacterium JGI_Cruoil_03_51_56]